MRDKKPDIEREWISREERNMTTKKNKIPVFKTLEEERAYWDARGPLADGHKGTINKPRPKQKLTSFLAVRLTGEELTKLRDIAAKQGVGPSTFARMILSSVIKQGDMLPNQLSFGEIMYSLTSRFSQEDVKKFDDLLKDVIIGDPDNPALLVFSGQRETWEKFASMFFERLLGVQVVPTENENLKKVREIVEK